MASLADIRARLAAQEEKSKKNFKASDSAVYAHWNIDEDATAILRFLEDGDTDNPFFWIERAVFKFPFNGVKASQTHSVEASDKEVIVQVPCMEMYDGEKDAVLDEVRTWFKDPTTEDMGRKYWKKRSYLFQGFVRQDPMAKEGDETPENPIRRFIISPQIFTLIKNSLMDPDIENLPTDTDGGLDFRINKTQKGGYADYSTSTWSRKESALTEEEIAAVDKHGLFNLKDFLPKKPDEATLKVIQEMFESSVEGEAYDIERFGKFYTPFGIDKVQSDANKPADTASTTETKAEEAKVETKAEETTLEEDVKKAEASVEAKAEEKVEADNDKTADILKLIRSRQK